MALRFCDSFDGYDSAHIAAKWNNPGAGSITTTNARNGQALKIDNTDVRRTVDDINTWIVGGAFFWPALSGGGVAILKNNTDQVKWLLNTDGRLVITGAGVMGTTSATLAIVSNRFYYIEMKASIGTAGVVDVHINGQPVFNGTGNTTPGGGTTADVAAVRGPGGANLLFVDDFYVCDNAGAKNNDFLGDVAISVIKPVSDGTTIQWTPSGTGTTHFNLVNEVPLSTNTGALPDDDATYVFTTGTGNIDLYNFSSIPTNLNVLGVQSNIFARKDDEGLRALSVVTLGSGGAQVVSDTGGRFTNLSYIDYLNQFDVDPTDGIAWTPAKINNTKWGVKLIL